MKTRQLASIIHDGGEYKIIYDYTKETNPFRIYRIWYQPSEHGLCKKKRLFDEYADYASCMSLLTTIIQRRNIERMD